ncbi:DUF4387 family protein [Pelagimonas varians]|uniref:DUF4387 domain-containing protein n=1 Tax=Pelagimonas varians TaxID=696760 RepID=A0A238JYI9_9RHOB|nr:DUF4387 family protein [Pelagimonas varians]PYG33061.1 uncharacterized protein DUF4387 [Pelagimonas varians]SMX35563.1 hypothetical protein PEV8663_00517 [Pelagimonas varians]
MTRLVDVAVKIRSKNAGPFWLTVDIFCGSAEVFDRVSAALKSDEVAKLFQMQTENLKRFDIADLYVVKFSLPRPQIQGVRADRDMHGASFANLLAELVV